MAAKQSSGVASVTINLESGTRLTYYPRRDQVQMLVIASDGFMFKESTVHVEQFLEIMEKIAQEKEQGSASV